MKLLVLTTLLAAGQSQSIVCKDRDIYQEDPNQCDQYYDCKEEGQTDPTPILCRDGLVFDPYSRQDEPCDHFFNVNCGDRGALQDAQGNNPKCPRLNGYYSHPNQTICNIYFSCEDGQPTENKCSPGLWFNEYSGVCDWPANAGREDPDTGYNPCQEGSQETLNNGWSCPITDPFDLAQNPNPRYPDLEDCEKFYICLNGIIPRHQGCDNNRVYNELTQQCDHIDNVPECQDPEENNDSTK